MSTSTQVAPEKGTDQPTRRPGPWREWFLERGLLVRIAVFVVAGVLLVLLVYPITRMIIRALFPDGALDLSVFARTVEQPWFWPAVTDTAIVVGCASVIALVLASLLAWLNERTDAGLGWLGGFMPLMPLLMPPIATAAGWTFLASPKIGFLNGLLEPLPGSPSVDILTMPGLIFIYVLEMIPYAYIPIAGALRNIDPALEEASRVSGAGIIQTLVRVALPAVSQALVSAFFLLVVVGFAIYSAPVVIGTNAGIEILSVRIVKLMQFTYPADLPSATVLTTILLTVVLAAWLLQQAVTKRARHAMISGRSGQSRVSLGRWRHGMRALTIIYLILTTVLPLIAVIIVALQPYWTTTIDPGVFTLENFERIFRRRNTTSALRTSLLLGAVGGLIAIAVCVLIGLAKRRTSFGQILGRRASTFIDAVMRLPGAFSHIVIALGFIVAFSGPPFNLNGTVLILLLCYLVAFMPQASTNTANALSQIGDDLTEASYMSRASEARTNGRIVLPLALPGLLSGWALLFMLFVSEVSASTMLSGSKTPVIGFVLVESWENGTVGPMAAFALVVTVINSCAVIALLLLGRQRFRNRR